jgi:hypothetical protein
MISVDKLDLRTYAAIILRVPKSGHPDIDQMIKLANERDGFLATANGVLSNSVNPPQDPVGTMPVITQYKGRTY